MRALAVCARKLGAREFTRFRATEQRPGADHARRRTLRVLPAFSASAILPVALALAKAAQAVWWPALSPDEVKRRYIDDVDAPGDWDKVGVVPDEIEQHAITYLRRYRSACVSMPCCITKSHADTG